MQVHVVRCNFHSPRMIPFLSKISAVIHKLYVYFLVSCIKSRTPSKILVHLPDARSFILSCNFVMGSNPIGNLDFFQVDVMSTFLHFWHFLEHISTFPNDLYITLELRHWSNQIAGSFLCFVFFSFLYCHATATILALLMLLTKLLVYSTVHYLLYQTFN